MPLELIYEILMLSEPPAKLLFNLYSIKMCQIVSRYCQVFLFRSSKPECGAGQLIDLDEVEVSIVLFVIILIV